MAGVQSIVILGPTAGGKSELAARLAEDGGGQVVSADSMQVYRHMDAGTAKPPPRLRQLAVHHLIDVVEPTEPFTVHDWLVRATEMIDRLRGDGVASVIVGGTNLYIKALLEGLFQGPPADAALRARLQDEPLDDLHARLTQVDPGAGQRIHRNDRKRIVRALEVYELTGRPISEWQTQWGDEPQGAQRRQAGTVRIRPDSALAPFKLIGLNWPTDEINARINHRVKAMFFPDKVEPDLARDICPNGESLPMEARRLHEAGMLGQQAREALGYKQVIDHLEGRCSLKEAFEQTRIHTRRFAKTQRTWLKRFTGVNWLDAAVCGSDELFETALRDVSHL